MLSGHSFFPSILLFQEHSTSDSTLCWRASFKSYSSDMCFRPGLSLHRYSVIFTADSKIFAFSAIFRTVPADFIFDTSGQDLVVIISDHLWFSVEHYWQQTKRWIPLNQPENVFFYYWCWKEENSKIPESIPMVFLKNSTSSFFRNLYFFLIPWL